MNLQNRIEAFTKLGQFLKIISNNEQTIDSCNEQCCIDFYNKLESQINASINHNGWFTKDNVIYAIKSWAEVLTADNLSKWVKAYDFSNTKQKTVGIITAGNIPLVGFHDFISVLMSGHHLLIKQSSNDQKLLPVIADFLSCVAPQFSNLISFEEKRLTNFDAIIATGSNNTARYFEHYFKNKPNIIRKNRNAIAILTGDESFEQMQALSEDIFKYFGLGCRSVSKIFVPKDYDFDKLFKAVFKQKDIVDYQKYENNYNYNKTVYLMSQMPLIENGFLVLKEDQSYASPIATLFYEYYNNQEQIKNKVLLEKDKIQCIVSDGITDDSIAFGTTQKPQLWDYADGVDTIKFLINL